MSTGPHPSERPAARSDAGQASRSAPGPTLGSPRAQACGLPVGSRIAALHTPGDTSDAYRMADPLPQCDALATYLALQGHSPWWMHTLLALRNAAVRPLGLKTGALGQSSDQAPCTQVGDRAGLFTLLERQPNEVVFGVDDRHLQVWLSLHKARDAQGDWVHMASLVRLHNGLGRAYLALVWPVHQRIVPRLMEYGARRV